MPNNFPTLYLNEESVSFTFVEINSDNGVLSFTLLYLTSTSKFCIKFEDIDLKIINLG